MARKKRRSQYSLTGYTYSSEDIERQKKQPGVVSVTPEMIVFELKFKQELYDEWVKSQSPETIRRGFAKRGADVAVFPNELFLRMNTRFRYDGRPKYQALPVYDRRDGEGLPHKTPDELVAEGVLDKYALGYKITPLYNDLIRKAYTEAYPEKSVEDVIRESGYNPSDIGATRLNYLHKALEGSRNIGRPGIEERKQQKAAVKEEATSVVREELPKVTSESTIRSKPEKVATTEQGTKSEEALKPTKINNSEKNAPRSFSWAGQVAENTPYMRTKKPGYVEFTEEFYNDAVQFQGLPISDILSIYCISLASIPPVLYPTLRRKLREWKPTDEPASFELPVAINRFVAMQRILDIELTEISEKFKQMSPPEKKKLCEVIDELPRDPVGEYSTQALRDKIGISQTLYYKYLRQERYGMKKADKAASDIEAVRQVFDYKGFSKGSRQIYMLMPRIVGRKMGLKKIRRIMQENGMASDIRGANIQKQVMRKYLQENRKPNLLERKFRLYRPNQVRLTDVTYLEYGPRKKRAYGSASIDPVTGKLIAFVVMDKNDQRLADATLQEMDNYPCEFGGKLHSDQGSLYLMPDFQAKVAESGMDQSMSRRGNCWDNSPQESFFGHFKDECNYAACVSMNELRELIEEYKYYYNFERRMWNHLQMTPVEYEAYLNALSDEEFQKYIDQGEAEYKEMQAHSIERAKARIRDLGAEDSVEDTEEGEKSHE